jgi:hypothetical protein
MGSSPSGVALIAALLLSCGGTTFSTRESPDGGSAGAGASNGGSAVGGATGGRFSIGGAVGTGGASGGTIGIAGAAGSGGAPDTVQLARDYDQSCRFDGECVLVTEGDVCFCLGCYNASIARSAQPKWDSDRNSIPCSAPIACPAVSCESQLAACASGTCSIRTPKIIDATKYDQSCQADSDCVVINTGEVCSVCRCSAGAINKNALPEYQKDIGTESCNPGPSPCDCATPTVSHCDTASTPGAGTCVLG